MEKLAILFWRKRYILKTPVFGIYLKKVQKGRFSLSDSTYALEIVLQGFRCLENKPYRYWEATLEKIL